MPQSIVLFINNFFRGAAFVLALAVLVSAFIFPQYLRSMGMPENRAVALAVLAIFGSIYACVSLVKDGEQDRNIRAMKAICLVGIVSVAAFITVSILS